jgi:hypothetical protein
MANLLDLAGVNGPLYRTVIIKEALNKSILDLSKHGKRKV